METLRYVVLANGLLVIVSTAYYVLLRRETFFGTNRLALWLGMAAALVLPVLELPDWRPQPVKKAMQRTAQVIMPKVVPSLPAARPEVTITFPNGRTYRIHRPPDFSGQQTNIVGSWQTTLLVCYLLGVLALLGRFSIRLISLLKLIRRSELIAYDGFTLVCTEGATSPFSFFGWVFLDPDRHTPDELEQILRHERVHVRSGHSLDMVASELICIVFWFNPAVYLFRHLLHQTLEFSADRAVLAEGVESVAYQYNLVKVSLSTSESLFTNQFSGSTLRQRISMINRQRSGSIAWGRYLIWVFVMGTMVFACRHKDDRFTNEQLSSRRTLPATSPTRARVLDLEDKVTWYRHLALYSTKFGTEAIQSEPVVLQMKGNRFFLPDDYKYESAIYINGKTASVNDLERLSPEFISELFVMRQGENMANKDTEAKTYQIMLQTNARPVPFDEERKRFFTLLQAAAITKYPLGESLSFTMNQLLEATFFHNRNALVERTKNEHLKLYDDYANTVEVFINNLPVEPADVATVHVREVARLYTKERPYTDWFRAQNPVPRFELHIQTAPKRAKRDSSYYVFSPFYTGDF